MGVIEINTVHQRAVGENRIAYRKLAREADHWVVTAPRKAGKRIDDPVCEFLVALRQGNPERIEHVELGALDNRAGHLVQAQFDCKSRERFGNQRVFSIVSRTEYGSHRKLLALSVVDAHRMAYYQAA